jgi:DNA polymerase-3 subunit beta
MKLSVLQENLSKGLNIVGRAVATRTTLPVTNNILLVTDEGRLKLSATNLEIAISCWVGAKVEEEGAITIPARLITDFVASLPNDRIDMNLSPRSQSLQLQCLRNEARISGMNAEEFPPVPEVGGEPLTKLEPDALRGAITQVEFAAASDDSRPVLTGIYAHFAEDELTLAAADGFRLAVYRVQLLNPVEEEREAIIPARSLRELARLLPDQEDPVEVTVNTERSQVLFHLGSVDLVSQLIQGSFPNYSQLIPASYSTRVVADRAEFLRATRIASIFAKDGSGIVRVQMFPGGEVTPGRMSISARAEEVGDNQGEFDAVIEGEEAKIAFNSRYIIDVLQVIPTAQVALEVTSPSSPGLLRPVGMDNYDHVVMPMFVQW